MPRMANVNRTKPSARYCIFVLLVVIGSVACDRRSPPDSVRSNTSSRASPVARAADSAGGDSPTPVNDRGPADTAAASHESATDILRHYYAAINAHDYDAAYVLWGQHGKASGQSRAQFAGGFANTADVRVTVSDSARVEGAAGSQYATIPVTIDATRRDGRRQHFVGTYVLRRAMVTGASEADRRWHIYSAHLTVRR